MNWLRGLLIVSLLCPAIARAANDTAGNKIVGTAAAVNPASLGTPPGEQSKKLLFGTNVVFKERIQTQWAGHTQILFLDQSTLTVAPNSEIVLDEFVYDPSTGTGRQAFSLGKGMLRFIGGAISHTVGMTIDTPTTSLTIRGGISIVAYGLDGGTTTRVLVVFGHVTAEPRGGNGVPQTFGTQGTLVSIGANGKIDSKPASNAEIAGFNAQFQGKSGGPVTVATVDQYLSSSGLTGALSPSPSLQTVANATSQVSTNISSIQNQTQVSNTVQQVASQPSSTTPVVAPSPPPPPPPVVGGQPPRRHPVTPTGRWWATTAAATAGSWWATTAATTAGRWWATTPATPTAADVRLSFRAIHVDSGTIHGRLRRRV
jgi:hypothetical protein